MAEVIVINDLGLDGQTFRTKKATYRVAFFALLMQERCKILILKEGTRSFNGKRALSNGNSHVFPA